MPDHLTVSPEVVPHASKSSMDAPEKPGVVNFELTTLSDGHRLGPTLLRQN